MGSLTPHLLETGDHGGLPFHASCPVCRRDRLSGTLSSEPLVSRRAQALLAGGLLAVSTPGPTAALATVPDQQQEGVAAPEHLDTSEADDPGFDPGGDTELPFDTAPAPAAPEGVEDTGDGAPLDVEPNVDLDAQPVPSGEAEAPTIDEQAPVPPVEIAPPAGDGAPLAGEAAPPLGDGAPPAADRTPLASEGAPSPAEGMPPAGGDEPSAGGDEPAAKVPTVGVSPHDKHAPSRGTRPTSPGKRPDAGAPGPSARLGRGTGAPSPADDAPAPPAAPVSTTALQGAASASASDASASPASTPIAQPVSAQAESPAAGSGGKGRIGNARFYVVEPGDSLWSIAKRLLGPGASPALIAREVDRLWLLNRSRIATGDPDLLMVGTRLELR